MASLAGPTFAPPGGYGRVPLGGYGAPAQPQAQYNVTRLPGRTIERWILPTPRSRVQFLGDYQSSSPHCPFPKHLQMKRDRSVPPEALIPSIRLLPPPTVDGRYLSAYPLMGPPRMLPRMAPSYYDYDYGGGYGGYGGGYGPSYGAPYGGYGGGYAPLAPPPAPRLSRYDHYLDDSDLDYTPPTTRYRPRYSSADIDDIEPSASKPDAGNRALPENLARPSTKPRSREVPSNIGESEGDRHMARLQHRYPSLSEPQALQDHVDKMRIRLKTLAFSLDPSGPVPEIVIPSRSGRGEDSSTKKYTTPALEYKEIPSLSARRPRYYPEDEHMKDNLRIKCLSQYKSTRTAAEYWKPKNYMMDDTPKILPDSYSSKYASKYGSASTTKWDEPDTVYGPSSDKKPYSKVETGSSFFSTYGYTNRKKDYVAEKVRDYYYFGDQPKEGSSVRFSSQAITESEAPEADVSEEKKERRKKKKSREPEDTKSIEAAPAAAAAPEPAAAAPSEAAEAAPAAAPAADASEAGAEDEVLDEKERKRLEKKKRKAEREAAAKAAMEAELEALAAAEAELAKLEAEGGAAPAETTVAAAYSAPQEIEELDVTVQEEQKPSGQDGPQSPIEEVTLPLPRSRSSDKPFTGEISAGGVASGDVEDVGFDGRVEEQQYVDYVEEQVAGDEDAHIAGGYTAAADEGEEQEAYTEAVPEGEDGGYEEIVVEESPEEVVVAGGGDEDYWAVDDSAGGTTAVVEIVDDE